MSGCEIGQKGSVEMVFLIKKKETNICTALKSYYVLMAQRQNAPLSMKRSRFEP